MWTRELIENKKENKMKHKTENEMGNENKNKRLIEKIESIVTKISQVKNLKDIPAKELKELGAINSQIGKVSNLDSVSNSIFLNLKEKISEKESEIEERNVWITNLENKMKILEKDSMDLKKKCREYENESTDLKKKCVVYENESREKKEELEEIYKSISYRFGKRISKNAIGKVVKKILNGEV